ncbi:hypothetical protein ACFVYE_37100 [Streptomyces sp. NPDC058239]|uniref:hypothetical protein n=1 Tax=Streptomyces sp. NPDC058239 TaxID=3346395 RepID=UPI0036F0FCD6
MTPSFFSPSRSRRLACTASILTVVTVAVGLLVLALGTGLPEAWWPRTGQAFAMDFTGRHGDSCALIKGPAKAYCEREGDTTGVASMQGSGDAAVWKAVPAAAAVGALVIWRRGTSTGRGQH